MTPRHLIEPGRLAGSALLRAQSDARLVDLTRAGNDRAFEAIVDRYRRPLLRYCSRILSDGRGEDALQQAFMNAYDSLKGGATPMSLRSWLFAIAHNAALNILRQRGGSHEQLEAHDGPAETAYDALERRGRFRQVLVAVAALPPTQRDAIVLRELEGRGHEEIARALGVTGGAARQLISRARNGIREAAAVIVPFPLLMRLTDGTAQPVTSDRLAELTVAGSGLSIGKIVATAAVGGALVGGAVESEKLVRDRDYGDVAEAEEPSARADALQAREEESDGATPRDAKTMSRRDRGSASAEVDDGAEQRSEGDFGSDEQSGDDLREEDDSHSGPGGDNETSDDNSGPGDGDGDGEEESGDDNSGPGGDELDSSGPGSGEDPTSESDNSGPGAGSDDSLQSDNSGPGSGDDSVDSDSSGPGSGIDDSVDTDNSGSGSGSSGSSGPH